MNVPTQAPPQPAKKGMSPLAWVGIGCAVIIVLGVIAMGAVGYFVKKQVNKFEKNPGMAAAELIVRANPDLELVSADEKTSTLTVKNKKTGEVVTFNAEDIKNGKLSVKTDKGSATFDASGGKDGATVKVTDEKGQEHVSTFGGGGPKNLPSWVPVYPGSTSQGTYDTSGPQGHTAAFSVTTKDSVDKVADWYESQLKASGFKVEKNTFATNGTTSGGAVTGKSDDEKRTVAVILSVAGDQTQAAVTFEEKK
jgi:hypothetical protein